MNSSFKIYFFLLFIFIFVVFDNLLSYKYLLRSKAPSKPYVRVPAGFFDSLAARSRKKQISSLQLAN